MVLIGFDTDGERHWLVDACGDCEISTDKSRAHDFKDASEAHRGIVQYLSPTRPWFIEVDGEIGEAQEPSKGYSPEKMMHAILENQVDTVRRDNDEGWLFKDLGIITATSTGDGLYARDVKKAVFLAIYIQVETATIERKPDGSIDYAYGFLNARFLPSQWDATKIGDMYTDKGIKAAVNAHLVSLGYTGKVGWSEAGRQENDEADFDFSYGLIDEVWPELKGSTQ